MVVVVVERECGRGSVRWCFGLGLRLGLDMGRGFGLRVRAEGYV